MAQFFLGTFVIPTCLRWLGAKVGSRTSLFTFAIDDWDLVDIASDVYPLHACIIPNNLIKEDILGRGQLYNVTQQMGLYLSVYL